MPDEEEEEEEEEEEKEKEKVEKCLHSATGEALRHRSSLSFVVRVFVDVSTIIARSLAIKMQHRIMVIGIE
jgi:uncharacterized protein YqhQ